MRKLEHHKSFPSGDATAASFFLAIYVYVFGLNVWCMIFFTIFVSLGRVYVFCHWIGDTIAGSFLGTALAYFLYSKAHFGFFSKPLFIVFAKATNLDIDFE